MEAVMKMDPAPETAAGNSDSHSPGATGHVHSGRRGFQLTEAHLPNTIDMFAGPNKSNGSPLVL